MLPPRVVLEQVEGKHTAPESFGIRVVLEGPLHNRATGEVPSWAKSAVYAAAPLADSPARFPSLAGVLAGTLVALVSFQVLEPTLSRLVRVLDALSLFGSEELEVVFIVQELVHNVKIPLDLLIEREVLGIKQGLVLQTVLQVLIDERVVGHASPF